MNLEDTLFAGAVIEQLQGNIILEDDSVLAALHLYQKAKPDLVGFLDESSHVKRLNRLNIHKDIEFCLTPDQYDVLPVLIGGELVIR